MEKRTLRIIATVLIGIALLLPLLASLIGSAINPEGWMSSPAMGYLIVSSYIYWFFQHYPLQAYALILLIVIVMILLRKNLTLLYILFSYLLFVLFFILSIMAMSVIKNADTSEFSSLYRQSVKESSVFVCLLN